MPLVPRLLTACMVAVLSLALSALPVRAQAPSAPMDTAKAAPGTQPTLPSRPMGFAEALKKSDSSRVADSLRSAADSLRAAADTASGSTTDTTAAARVPRNYGWYGPGPQARPCPDALESASICWREDPRLANQDVGFPGLRAWTLSQGSLEQVPVASPYFPGWKNSPYLNGGLLPPDRYALKGSGGSVEAIEETWLPVVPLDTPVTSLEWERGALTLNVFHLHLRRMLSDRVYLGLDYYSASADSQTYDYQFNVHQPYLGGWGFLGQIYAPIDRDSSSIVLGGLAPSIDALNFRPKVGFWLDTNQVLEFFMDRVSNNSSLMWPRRPGASDTLGPADSTQTLMPASFSAYTGGVIHGWAGGGWSSQWEFAASSLEKETFGADSAGSGKDAWEGNQFRLRGQVAAVGWSLGPFLEAEALSEAWSGDLRFTRSQGPGVSEGWADRQSLRLGFRPALGPLTGEADAGAERSSRMGDEVHVLPRAGAAAALEMPLGLKARAGIDYRERDPDWELLHRRNPALLRYHSPSLQPRTDLGYRAEVSWELPFLRLGAGGEISQGREVWLPAVLPDPDACAAVQDSLYGYASPSACAGGKLPDSLALGLRNWDREDRIAWHLALGLDVGNWSLDLRNLFLIHAEAEDDAVSIALADRTVPARIFKGKLRWGRGLLEDKLKVEVGWGWEWFATRYAWVPDLRGQSAARKLDEYLALDFHASMRIRTFLLYFKGVNFNHDRYAVEPGSHPPGVNFRFGIDWTLFN